MKRKKIFRILCLVAYIAIAIVLIYESCLDGNKSANQSNAVGGNIAGIINNSKGDQAKEVKPLKVNIINIENKVYVSDTLKLKHKTSPDDCTYLSYEYTTSNDDIASIDETGYITFKSEGSVTISCINSYDSNVKDSIVFEVVNRYASDIDISINGVDIIDNKYNLYIDKEYKIDTKFIPNNTTYKNLGYEYFVKYCTITKDGILRTLETGENIVVKVIYKNIVKSIIINILENEIIDENVTKIEHSNIELYPLEEYKITPYFTPLVIKKPDFEVEYDSDIIEINNNVIKGLKPGNTTIKLSLKENKEIFCTIYINVKNSPPLTDFNVLNCPKKLLVNNNVKLIINNIPMYSMGDFKFKSSNENILKVSKDGMLTGISEGDVELTLNSKGIEKTYEIKVLSTTSSDIVDFELNIKSKYIEANKEMNLEDYIKINKFFIEGKVEIEPENKEIIYSALNNNTKIIDDSILYASPGIVKIRVMHMASGVYKDLEFYSYLPININDNVVDNVYINEEKRLILENKEYYKVIPDNKIALYEINQIFIIKGINVGKSKLKIYPIIDDMVLEEKGETIEIDVKHKYASCIDTFVYLNDNLENVIRDNITLKLSDKVCISSNAINATISKFKYTSSDPSILSVKTDGNIVIYKTGSVVIEAYDEYSKRKDTINVKINNIIELEEEPIKISDNISFNGEDNTYSIVNGQSGDLSLSFSKDTTYKKVTYSSSDENIAQIGKDGKITTHKSGVVSIRISCDDPLDDLEEISYIITLKVEKKSAIEDLGNFLYKVRKGLGHFFAFFILGVFSTLTFLLYFKYEYLLVGFVINIAQGFGLAVLTEEIQRHVPGRSGNYTDVEIDFTGFSISCYMIGFLMLIICLIKKKRKKCQKNK